MKRRFEVVEYLSHYAVRDLFTDKEAAMGDGVDTLFTKTGKTMVPGSNYFRLAWQKMLNEDCNETYEAYFK